MPHDYYYSPDLFTMDSSVFLKEEAHHLKVMRKKPREEITLINGLGQIASARLESVDRGGALLSLLSIYNHPASSRQTILVQAIPKLHRLDAIVEKGTELGMTHLWLFPGERSEKRELSTAQQQRLKSLTISALKQSGRLFLPQIDFLPPIERWEKLNHVTLYGDLSPTAPSFQTYLTKHTPSSLSFVVGPEAGLSAKEIGHLHRLKAYGVKLCDYTLRVDTASISALALLCHWTAEQV